MKNDIHIPQWEMIQTIVDESDKLKMFWRLKSKGYKYVFAPDFSEINSYIVPYRDFDEGNFERSLRQWYAIKVMLENKDNTNVLLPPYMAELSIFIKIIRQRKRSWDVIKDPLRLLFETPDFLGELSDLRNSIAGEKYDPEVVINYMERQGAKIGLLFELMSTHTEIDLIQKLWKNKLIHESFDYFADIDDEAVLRNSLNWELRINQIRKGRIDRSPDRILLNSHFDGWAVEYIRAANLIAKKKSKDSYFVVFISRSIEIFELFEKHLDFRIPEVGKFRPLWKPETYLAYHIIQTSPNTDYESIFKVLDHLYRFHRDYSARNEQPSSDVLKKILNTTKLTDSIQNLISFREKANDEDFSRFLDVKKINNYSPEDTSKLIAQIINFFTKQDIRILLDSTSKKIDELWWKFGKGFPTINIAAINKEPHVTIKYPGHRVWINFKSNEIIDWIGHENPLNAIEKFDEHIETLQMKGVPGNELLLLKAIKWMLLEDWGRLKPLLEELENDDDEYIRNEAFLINYSMDYLDTTKGSNTNFPQLELGLTDKKDARMLKVFSILLWKDWESERDIKALLRCYEYGQIAYALVEDETEFKVECLNNLAYYQMLLFEEKNDLVPSVKQVVEIYKELKTKCEQIYGDDVIPIEVYHTLGRLQITQALNDNTLTPKDKREILSSGIDNLEIAFRSDRTNTRYLKDFENAKRKLDELNIELRKHPSKVPIVNKT